MSSVNMIISSQDNNTEIEHYYDKKPLTSSPPRDHKLLSNNTIPSRAKKLVDKFTTFSPGRTRNKGSDRQLTVETTICNAGRKESQPEVRSSKSTDPSKVKKKKRPPVNITEGMSRADIFAAKVSSAVDAWEDTDDEDFIYRDRGHSRTSSGGSLNGPNPHSPFTSPHMPQGYNYSISSHNSFGYSRYGSLNRPQDYGYIQGNAPEPPDDYIPRGYKNFGMHKSGTIRPALPDMWVRVKGEYPNYGATEYYYPDSVETPYYGHDSRRLPLFIKRRQPFEDKRRRNSNMTSLWTMFIACFLLAICFFFYYVSTRPLREVGIVDITSVLAADKELIFDMQVQARNFDMWDIEVVDADLDIFAIPMNVGQPADQETTKNSTSVVQNEYLGRILYLDEKLVFTGGTHRKGIVSTASSQVRLKNPGGRSDKDAQNRWSHIFRHDFALVVRGFLKYSLPFAESNSVRVCYVRTVDGATAPSDNSTTKQPFALDVMTACNEEWN